MTQEISTALCSCGVVANVQDGNSPCVQTPVMPLHSLSELYPREMHKPLYPTKLWAKWIIFFHISISYSVYFHSITTNKVYKYRISALKFMCNFCLSFINQRSCFSIKLSAIEFDCFKVNFYFHQQISQKLSKYQMKKI